MLMILLSAMESDEDRRKFIALYEQYHARMERTAMRILKEQRDAEDATVYYELEEKVKKSAEPHTVFPGYKVLYGLFSKSGFTQRMLDQAKGQDDILLTMGTEVIS